MEHLNQTLEPEQISKTPCQLVYVLYLIGIVVGFTSLIGLVIAYIYRSDAPEWQKTHYQFQIRTFWISLLFGLIGFILMLVVIGYAVLIATLIWYIIRCVKGLKYLNQNQAYPEPETWMF